MEWDGIAQFDFKLQRKLRSSQGRPKGVMTIETIDIECGLLSRVSKKN